MRYLLSFALAILLFPSMVFAQGDVGKLAGGGFEFGGGFLINLGRMAYGTNVVGTGEVDYASVEANIGYFITPRFEFQGGLGFGWLNWDEFGYSQNVLMLDGGPTFNLETGARLVPYTFARFGLGSFSRNYKGTEHLTSYSETKNGAFVRFGGGMRVFVADDWNIKLEARSDKAFIENTAVTTTVMMYLTWLSRR